QMNDYIRTKTRKVSRGMIRIYNVVKERLLAFQKYRKKSITFDSFDSIKQLRIFLRDRTRRKIIPAIDLTDFKILDEEADAIYLTVAEIRALYQVDLSSYPGWGRFRDMFVLGCYTGLQFSDYSGIKPEDI